MTQKFAFAVPQRHLRNVFSTAEWRTAKVKAYFSFKLGCLGAAAIINSGKT